MIVMNSFILEEMKFSSDLPVLCVQKCLVMLCRGFQLSVGELIKGQCKHCLREPFLREKFLAL